MIIVSKIFVVLVAVFVGAAWRRWLGSARPKFVINRLDPAWRELFGIDNPKRGFPLRGIQVILGCVAMYYLARWGGDAWWLAAIETAVAMVIFTVSAHTRDPFIWLAEKLRLPNMWGTMLNGPDPWGEAMQGALVFILVAI